MDLTDEDGDGSTSVRRDFVAGFESAFVVGNDMDLLHSSVVVGGNLSLGPTSTQSAYAKLKSALSWESGELTMVVKVVSVGGLGCRLRVDTATTSYTSVLSAPGVHVRAFPDVAPGHSLSWVGVQCVPGTSSLVLDWLTVQNGPYEWAPMVDTSFTFSGMGFPNGGWDDWNDASEQAVMEVFAEWRGDEFFSGATLGYRDASEFDVYALTGEDGWGHGGLWLSDDLAATGTAGQSWTEITGEVLAFKHRDDCTSLAGGSASAKELSSGRLLLNHPGNEDWLVIASGGTSAGPSRGVYLWEKGTTWAANQPFSGLPTGSGYSPLPAALASGSDGSAEVLLVGYRVMASTTVSGGALYACPAGFDPATASPPFACAAVVDPDGTTPHDVRDIVPVPGLPGRYYAVDGGRTAGSANGACTAGESTVYGVQLSGFSARVLAADVWDLDTQDSAPPWLLDASGYPGEAYYTTEQTDGEVACYSAPADTFGALVAPDMRVGNEANELASVEVSPDGAWLFAFYPLPNNTAHWGCAPMFRAPLLPGALPGEPLDWEPVQEWVYGEMDWNDDAYGSLGHTHASTRRSHVHTLGSYLTDEPLPEFFAGTGVQDAVFVPGPSGDDLLSAGALTWWLLPDGHDYSDPVSGAPDADGVGWGTAYTELDAAAWVLSWAGHTYEEVFQDLATDAIAVCPGCRRTTSAGGDVVRSDTLIGGGGGDYKFALLYAGDGPQLPAERPCEFHMVGARPEEIETWVDPEEVSPSQAWMIFTGTWGATELVDQNLQRGVWFSEEATGVDVGEEWCWDGVAVAGEPGWGAPAYIDDGTLEAECQDEGGLVPGNGYAPCGGLSAAFGMHDGVPAVGQPMDLKVLGTDVAVLAAAPAARTDPASAEEPGSGGLWVVTNTGSGLDYSKVEFDPTDMGDCDDEDSFFAYRLSSGLANWIRLTVHPSSLRAYDASPPAPDPVVRVFVTSDEAACGVAEVSWEPGGEADATWHLLDLEQDLDGTAGPDCKLRGNTSSDFLLRGAHASGDARWLFVYAGVTSVGGGYSSLSSVCAIDLETGGDGVYGAYRSVVGQPQMQMAIESFVSHPHVGDLWYFGGYGVPACDLCTPPGVFALQRRRRWNGFAWTDGWGFYRVSADDLQLRSISEVTLGPAGDHLDAVRRMYVSTHGGSWWDGQVSW